MWEWQAVSYECEADVPRIGITFPEKQMMPTPFHEIDQGQFLRFLTGSERLRAYCFEQLHIDWKDENEDKGQLYFVRFFGYYSRVIAIATNDSMMPFNEGYYRYFTIGCDHPLIAEIPTNKMFHHKYHCPDCGYTEETWSD